MWLQYRIPVFLLIILNLCLLSAATAEELRNDGWETGGTLSFQAGFVSGEIGAVRLVPLIPGSWPLQNVQLMFGGATTLESIVLHIWDDSAGTINPGTELYSETIQILGADDFMSEVDLSATGVFVDGPIRVGIEFTHSGTPSIARDTDGSIDTSRNFIYSGGVWYPSNLFGLTGDWIIRANTTAVAGFTVGGLVSGLSGSMTLQNNGGDDLVITSDGPFTFATVLDDGDPYNVTILSSPAEQSCVVSNGVGLISGASVSDVLVTCTGGSGGATTLANDSFVDGGAAAFQGGFVTGEIAASRLTTPNTDPWSVDSVELLFGGEATQRTVTLKIWEDDAGTSAPGAELYSADYLLTGGDYLQQIDLSAAGLSVSGDFRVGVQVQHDGFPSVARDDDGITPSRNFIYISAGTWYDSSLLGLTGDWIIRATVSQDVPVVPFEITSIADFPNDQGRRVRITWPGHVNDVPAGSPLVTGYAIFRRIEDGLKAYPPGDWDYLMTVPAFGEAQYSTIVETAADSTLADGMHWTTVFVRAMTASPSVYFDSAPDSGYSLDNLAPLAPSGLTVAYDATSGNALSWLESTADDFAYFKIYRGDAPDFTVDPQAPLQTTTAAGWIDTDGDFDSVYRISAVDFAGNESPLTDTGNTVYSAVGIPPRTALHPIYPNPFNPSATIRFTLKDGGPVRVSVYDVGGRRVRTLLDETVTGGSHHLSWDGRNERGRALASGVFFARLEAGTFTGTRRMVLVR